MDATEDLEDGEIEDDDDEDACDADKKPNDLGDSKIAVDPKNKDKKETADEKKKRHDKKKLTEAEKSVMRLHKIERLEREKRDKYRRQDAEEDYATTLEKAIASVLKKDKPPSGDEEKEVVEDKRGKKRKKKDKHNKKSKKNKPESPKIEEIDENEMMNIRGGSPEPVKELMNLKTDEESEESDSSSDKSTEKVKEHRGKQKNKNNKSGKGSQKRKKKYRERSKDREKWNKGQNKRNTGVCLYFLQGMCNDDNCQYSHESIQPIKLELCKFYLLECCAKGDKCLYMHSDFPCKFYHTGIPCPSLEKCKFAHGGPLSDGLKQILFKHIETAPKEILGNFPRLSRENASVMINQAQGNLEKKYGSVKKDKDQDNNGGGKVSGCIPSLFDVSFNAPPDIQQQLMDNADRNNENSKKENKRNRPSRWQDPDPNDLSALQEKQKTLQMQLGYNLSKSAFKDQDMRINSNGDVDMRSLSLPPQQQQQTTIHPTNIVNPNILAQAPAMLPTQTNLISNLLAQTAIVPNLFNQQQATLQDVINSAVLLNQQQQQLQNNQTTSLTSSDASSAAVDIEKYKMEAGLMPMDTDIRAELVDVKVEDVDHRQISQISQANLVRAASQEEELMNDEPENNLQIVLDEPKTEPIEPVINKRTDFLDNLPKTQRDLFMRIQAQQKENVMDEKKVESDNEESNINWYSDDEDDNKLTIGDDFGEDQSDADNPLPAQIKPMEMIEKLGDLSKIDISAEVTKLLSTISQSSAQNIRKQTILSPKVSDVKVEVKMEVKMEDPRIESTKSHPRSPRADPRKSRLSSHEEKVSIYDQTNLADAVSKDIDLRHVDQDFRTQLKDTDLRASAGRPDIDLRQMGLPFKAMQNYTPASEIDASISSHPPMSWRVNIVEIPKPDYTGLKLSATEAETTGDPRLRKIFRLSIDEKDSPASPKQSPKQLTPTNTTSTSSSSSAAQTRMDPRRRKLEAEQKESIGSGLMTYAQQLSVLQASPFYQTLTSNQKVTLNQELATKNDQTGQNDPIITAMLQNLGLVTSQVASQSGQSQALNILANISQLGFPQGANLGPNPQMMLPPQIANQGILGAGPGLPNLQNLPPEFAINFDPRNGGLLGNGPPPFGNFQPDNFNPPDGSGGNNFGNFNDDFFPPDQQGGGAYNNNSGNNNGNSNNNNRDRGYRDRPRRGGRNNNNHRNNRNFFRRNNRNRNNSPP